LDQKELNYYFANFWHSTTDHYIYSGMTIIDKIQPDDEVIDVGCGRNQFKKHINKLTGIDPARDEADIKCTIEDFNPKLKFDVALCLGSINF